MKDLFHVSCFDYRVGQELIATDETFYSKQKKAAGEDWVNSLLNSKKPVDAPGREFTFYAFDNIGNCHAFISSTSPCDKGIPKYYKVRMINPIKTPMCLTDLILAEGSASSKLEQILVEYWRPTKNWKYLEYLSHQMEVLEIMPEPNLIDRIQGKSNYQDDYYLKEAFCKSLS